MPFEEPGTKDPHATGITQSLSGDLQQQGFTVKAIPPTDHLQAVAAAADLCRDNGAAGLLVAEGRYEQTQKRTFIPFSPVQITSYPTHVELRLDEIDCAGKIAWTAYASADQRPSGPDFGGPQMVTNVGAA
ncbi:MAG TPA: hypothetical protein VKG44_00785, partial [Candidatus Baltobacteraceae bacterium]|nr:hypothetical protein [Candidatus Baltobacteraceae bacterium]